MFAAWCCAMIAGSGGSKNLKWGDSTAKKRAFNLKIICKWGIFNHVRFDFGNFHSQFWALWISLNGPTCQWTWAYPILRRAHMENTYHWYHWSLWNSVGMLEHFLSSLHCSGVIARPFVPLRDRTSFLRLWHVLCRHRMDRHMEPLGGRGAQLLEQQPVRVRGCKSATTGSFSLQA